MNRRQFLIGLGTLTAAAAAPFALNQAIELTRRRYALWGDGGSALKLAQLSDLHFSRAVSLSHIESAIDLVVRERPDVICLTGDFITDRAPDPEGYARVLRGLSATAPTFACLGNHDGGRWSAARGHAAAPDAVVEILRAARIDVLRNESRELSIRSRAFLLTGVEDLWSFAIDARAAGFSDDRRPRIVLAHNPDTKDALARAPWALMLCGHTHGGQIRLPFFGGRLTAPVRDDRYIEGLLTWGSRVLHITRGVGALHGVRINCPPEVNVLELA
jgi:predicted MPP superfamily phosphohydrolase